MATVQHDVESKVETLGEALQAVKLLRAYLECSEAVQAGIREMLAVLNDPETDEDDYEMTLFTLAEALFPDRHEGRIGTDLWESERLDAESSEEMRAAIQRLDEEEAAFSRRVREAMQQRGWTQEQLAEKLGIGQPAVSNILTRQSRPQRRTVERFAAALDVEPEALWPQWPPSGNESAV